MAKSANDTVKSTDTAFSILEYVRDDGPAGVTEISEHIGMSKGAVHRYLVTLSELGYLNKQSDGYRIGLGFILFGSVAKDREYVHQLAEPKVRELAEDTGERVQFIAEENGLGVYIHIKSGVNAVHTNTREGKITHLPTSAAGKSILAFSPEPWVNDVLDKHGLQRLTSNTITSRERLFEELEEIRRRGYAINKEEHIEGLWGTGVPIRGPDDGVLGAISVSGPTHRVKNQILSEGIPNKILGVVNEIELNLRYE